MRILITGATGYLGTRLASMWREAGHAVMAPTRCDRPLPADVVAQGGIDAVVHTACCYGRRGEPLSEMFDANVLSPLRLLEHLPEGTMFLNADTVLPPELNTHAMSKHAFRCAGGQVAKTRGLRWCNLRLEHFYGPGEGEDKFVSYTVRACLRQDEVNFTGGEQRRDFVFIDDVAAAFDLGLRLAPDPGVITEVYVGSGQPVRIRDLVERIYALSGSHSRMKFGAIPYREYEPMDTAPPGAPSLEKFGWRAKVKLEDGLRRVIAYEKERAGVACAC